jgi:hypothetical protein
VLVVRPVLADRTRLGTPDLPPGPASAGWRPATRIGLIAPPWIAVPPPAYGGTEEVIDHGRTGYLCRGEDEMTAAVARIGEFDRWQRRAAAGRRFALARMAAGYDRLYQAMLEHPGRVLEVMPRANGSARLSAGPDLRGGTGERHEQAGPSPLAGGEPPP